MRISFTGRQKGSDVPYLNLAVFRLPDGKRIRVDRDETDYDFEDGDLSMEWRGCYVWDGEKPDYDITPEALKDAVLEEVEIEDDAPEGYSFTLISYSVY